MKYWLIKSEPSTWSWDDHKLKKVVGWDGVRSYQAAGYMKIMKQGDHAFFYHSVKEKRIMGIVEVVKGFYPDETDEAGKFVKVDFKFLKDLNLLISLASIKADPRLSHLALVRQSRLSVMLIDKESWQLLLKMGGML